MEGPFGVERVRILTSPRRQDYLSAGVPGEAQVSKAPRLVNRDGRGKPGKTLHGVPSLYP
jgi:hypothetical protein